jgi:hypothetical protein
MRLRPFAFAKLLRHLPIRRAIVNRTEPPASVLSAFGASAREKGLLGIKSEGPL